MGDSIVTYGDEILRAKAEEFEEFDDAVQELIERMYLILAESHGLGLAGPQVGVSKRIFVYDIGEGQHALVNPKIIKSGGEEWSVEGCLSVPGLQGEVPRAERVTVTGLDENRKKVKINADGILARMFQHEIDHLDGMLFIDRADPDTLEMIPIGGSDEEGIES